MLKLQSLKLTLCVGVVALVVAGSGSASAKEAAWPIHPITIYVGFAAGGYADTVARVIGSELSKKLGQPVIIENIGGAGGNTAALKVSTSANDGYSLLVTTTALAINTTLYKEKGFSVSGLEPIAIPAIAPEALVARKGANINALKDLPAAAKRGKLYLATPGIGSGSQIAETYFFKKLIKLPVTQIPFLGGGPAMQGLLTGDANLMASTAVVQTISSIVGKQIVGLAVASPKRDPAIPNVPTFAEQGYPNFYASSWVGFFAPQGTSKAIVNKLNKDINDILEEPYIHKTFDRLGVQPQIRTAAETRADFNDEVKRWATMVDTIGLKL